MRENQPLNGRIPPKSGYLDSLSFCCGYQKLLVTCQTTLEGGCLKQLSPYSRPSIFFLLLVSSFSPFFILLSVFCRRYQKLLANHQTTLEGGCLKQQSADLSSFLFPHSSLFFHFSMLWLPQAFGDSSNHPGGWVPQATVTIHHFPFSFDLVDCLKNEDNIAYIITLY